MTGRSAWPRSGRVVLRPLRRRPLSDTDVVQPDLLFVSRERKQLLSGGDNVRGAPDLVMEILSPATADRDRGYKRAVYARHGVAEYWLVDPTAETVWIHRPRGGSLEVAHTFGRGQTLHRPC
ncbi:MAG: Uma2 family endonuclease [Gammaproteobacteria bacterium]|nr:Uma2 family endonuclease [Gammaproteobacteria bacterium]